MLQGFISMHINAELYLNQNNGYNIFFFPHDIVCLSGLNTTHFLCQPPNTSIHPHGGCFTCTFYGTVKGVNKYIMVNCCL